MRGVYNFIAFVVICVFMALTWWFAGYEFSNRYIDVGIAFFFSGIFVVWATSLFDHVVNN